MLYTVEVSPKNNRTPPTISRGKRYNFIINNNNNKRKNNREWGFSPETL
jgi:hypothetical protein